MPAAYDTKGGPQFWELVHRGRASANQMFVAAISTARNEKHGYATYGHSMFIDPIGDIQAEAGIAEEILFHEIGSI